MYYEVTLKFDTPTDKGVSYTSHKVIVSGVNLFAQAELSAMQYAKNNKAGGEASGEDDVTAIRRSRIREFANSSDDGQKIYFAVLDDAFVEDSGKVKHTRYVVGVYADDMTHAKIATDAYMRQGFDGLTLVGINETPYECVIE